MHLRAATLFPAPGRQVVEGGGGGGVRGRGVVQHECMNQTRLSDAGQRAERWRRAHLQQLLRGLGLLCHLRFFLLEERG